MSARIASVTAPTRSGTRLPYLPALDGLRGVAVLAVLVYHAGFAWAVGGYLGVSTFFTLSGYLITALLLEEWRRHGRIDLKRFWIRRLRRLLPASLLALGLIVVLAATVAHPSQLDGLRADLVAALTDVANWRFVLADESYADVLTGPSLVLHFWSLAIEEQFYLLFPLLAVGLLAITRGSRPRVASVMAVLVGASLALAVFAGWSDDRVYFGTDTRASELLVGALLAVLLHRVEMPRRARTGVVWLGVPALASMVLLMATTEQSRSWLYSGGLTGYALLSSLVILAAIQPRGPARALLAWAPLVGMGRISYGLYLYHWPVFLWLTPARTGLEAWPLFGLRVAVALAVSVVSYVLVEQPVRRGQALSGRWSAGLVPIAGAGIVVALFAVTTSATVRIDLEGAERELAIARQEVLQRYAAPASASVSAAAPISASASVAASASASAAAPISAAASASAVAEPVPAVDRGSDGAETIIERDGPLRVLMVGDSTAMMLGFGLNEWAHATGEMELASLATIGCGVGRGGARVYVGDPQEIPPNCAEVWRQWSELVSDFDPDLVVGLTGPLEVADRLLAGDDTWRAPGDPVYDAYLRRELTAATDVLTVNGAWMVWATSPLIELGKTEVPRPSEPYPASDPARMARFNQLLGQVVVQHDRALSVDLAGHLAQYPGGELDSDIRPDGVHLADDTTRLVGDWLGPELLRLVGSG